MRASIGFFKSSVNSVMLTMYCEQQLSNTVVAVIRDAAMLQMFMHVYVIANCTTVAALQRQSHCALNEAQKQSQCTCLAETVVGSSLTPRAPLLVLPVGTVYPVVDRHEFTRSEKWCLHVKANLAICILVISVSG